MLTSRCRRTIPSLGASIGLNECRAARTFSSSRPLALPQRPRKSPFGYSSAGWKWRSKAGQLSKKAQETSRRHETAMARTERKLQQAKSARDNAAVARLEHQIRGHWIELEGMEYVSRMCYALDELPEQMKHDPSRIGATPPSRSSYQLLSPISNGAEGFSSHSPGAAWSCVTWTANRRTPPLRHKSRGGFGVSPGPLLAMVTPTLIRWQRKASELAKKDQSKD